MNTCFVLGPVLEAGDRAENKKDIDNCPCRCTPQGGREGCREAVPPGENQAGVDANGTVSEKSCGSWEGKG